MRGKGRDGMGEGEWLRQREINDLTLIRVKSA